METLLNKFRDLIIKCEIEYCDELQTSVFDDKPEGYQIKSFNGFYSENDYYFKLRGLMSEIRQHIDSMVNDKFTELMKLKTFILDIKGYISDPHFDGYMNHYSHRSIPTDFNEKAYLPWHLSLYLDKAFNTIKDLEEWTLDSLKLVQKLPVNLKVPQSSSSLSKIDKLNLILNKLIEEQVTICDNIDSFRLCEYLLKQKVPNNPIYLKTDNRQFKAFYDFTRDYFPPAIKQNEIEQHSILYTEKRKILTAAALTEAGYNSNSSKPDKNVKPKNYDLIEEMFKKI